MSDDEDGGDTEIKQNWQRKIKDVTDTEPTFWTNALTKNPTADWGAHSSCVADRLRADAGDPAMKFLN